MKTSDKGLEFIKQNEGLRLKKYRDSAGLYTVGVGHKILPGEKLDSITEAQALTLLKKDLADKEKAVNKFVTVPLTQNQFDSLIDFVFNVGTGAFYNSTLRRLLNQGNYDMAASQFLVWNKTRVNGEMVVVDGLTKRRQREKELFETKEGEEK